MNTLPTSFLDATNPLVMRHVEQAVQGRSGIERVEAWYHVVRDGIWYDPWRISFDRRQLKASRVLEDQRGHCIAKATLFVAGCRSMNVPARLGLARVRNHLGTAELEAMLQTDVLVPHGYAEVWNGARWVKCTPAFNKELCDRLDVPVLDFNPTEDSLLQANDKAGNSFLTYLQDYGTFDDLPVDFIRILFRAEYPHVFDSAGRFISKRLRRNQA